MREADWRYLLPAPGDEGFDRLVVIGGSADLLNVIRRLKIAREVVDRAGPEQADAVAVVGAGCLETTEAAALSMLRVGGVLYYEVDRTRAAARRRSPQRVARAIRAGSASVVASYWVRPTLEHRQLFLPLDSPEALRWFQRSTFPRETFVQRAKSVVFDLLIGMGGVASSFLARRFAVVARKGGGASSGAGILSHAAFPAEVRDMTTRVVLIARGHRPDVGKIVALPFTRGSSRPWGVLKRVRGTDVTDFVEVEQARLTTIRDLLGPELRRSLPEPMATVQVEGVTVLLESFLPGEPILSLSRAWGEPIRAKMEGLRRATDWIAEFGIQTRIGDPAWTEERHADLVEEPLRRFAAMFSLDEAEEELFARIAERSRSLIGGDLPVVWNHGDFAPWNVLLQSDGVAVLDWEDASEGLPLIDLLNIARIWYKDVRQDPGSADREGEILALMGVPEDDPLAVFIDGLIRGYMERLGIDPAFRAIAITVPWARRVADTAVHARRFGDGPELTEARRNVIRTLARNQDRLLGDRPAERVAAR